MHILQELWENYVLFPLGYFNIKFYDMTLTDFPQCPNCGAKVLTKTRKKVEFECLTILTQKRSYISQKRNLVCYDIEDSQFKGEYA